MYRTRISGIHGFSLVELLVAMVIGLIGSIIIFQVYAGFEGQRRNTTSGGDATTNMAAATNALEQAGRDAGYGLNFPTHMGCAAIGWTENANPTVLPHVPGKIYALKLMPVNIVRTGNVATGAFESLTFSRNTNDNSYSVTTLKSPMDSGPLDVPPPAIPAAATTTEAPLCLENTYGIKNGDVLVLAEHKTTDTGVKAGKITCAVTEVTGMRTDPRCLKPLIDHTYGSFTSGDPLIPGTQYSYFNKPGGLGSIADTGAVGTALDSLDSTLDSPARNAPALFTFKSGAYVMNLGPKKNGGVSGFQSTTFTRQNDQLMVSSTPGDPGVALVDGIVFMDAQYGSASSPTTTSPTLTYSKLLPETATNDPKISQNTWFSLRTVRLVLITKSSQYDKDYTSPAAITVWTSPLDVTYNIPAGDARHYRYKVVELVIPLRNMFWKP
jgi:type IV pilus assembly protein PilW